MYGKSPSRRFSFFLHDLSPDLIGVGRIRTAAAKSHRHSFDHCKQARGHVDGSGGGFYGNRLGGIKGDTGNSGYSSYLEASPVLSHVRRFR